MQEIIVKNFEEIHKIIDGLRDPFTQLQFRGQICNDCNWTLTPSVSRNVKSEEEAKKIELWFLEEFRKRLKGKGLTNRVMEKDNPREFQNDWEWLTQAQHYGLPTRLMDWSLDWNTGLYFSVDDPTFDRTDGQLWVYRCPNGIIYGDAKEEGYNDFYSLNPFDINEAIIVNPSYFYFDNHKDFIGHERRWRQMGRFLVQSDTGSITPLENNPEFSDDLVKLIIPASIKASIRDKYDSHGFNNDYLYGEKDEEIESILKDLKRFKETK